MTTTNKPYLLVASNAEFQSTSDNLCYKKELIYEGDFYDQKTDLTFHVTEDVIDHWIETYAKYTKAGNRVPVPWEHLTTHDEDKNAGYVTALSKETNKRGQVALFATICFKSNDVAQKAVGEQVSIYVPQEHIDSEKNKYVQPIEHVALTSKPVVTKLEEFIALSRKEEYSMSFLEFAKELELEMSEDMTEDQAKEAIMSFIASMKKEVEDMKAAKDDTSSEEEELEASEDSEDSEEEKEAPMKASKAMLSMLKENRELKLSQLLENGKITPAVHKNLKAKYLSNASIELAFSNESADTFSDVFETLNTNESIVSFDETSGPQSLRLSKQDEEESNPLLRAIDKKKQNQY